MTALTLTLPLPPRDLCGNGRRKRFSTDRLRAAQREDARTSARVALGLPLNGTLDTPIFPPHVLVRVDAVVHRAPFWAARALDDDNFWIGLKSARDALADIGIMSNARQCRIGSIAWVTARPGEHGVVLTLTALAPAAPAPGNPKRRRDAP